MAKLTEQQEMDRDKARYEAKKKALDLEPAVAAAERAFKAIAAEAKDGKVAQTDDIRAHAVTYGNRLAELNDARKEVARLKKADALAAPPINLVSHEKE